MQSFRSCWRNTHDQFLRWRRTNNEEYQIEIKYSCHLGWNTSHGTAGGMSELCRYGLYRGPRRCHGGTCPKNGNEHKLPRCAKHLVSEKRNYCKKHHAAARTRYGQDCPPRLRPQGKLYTR